MADDKPPVVRMPDDDGTPTPDVWTGEGLFDTAKAAELYEAMKHWPDDQKRAMLASLRSAETRAAIKVKYANAAEIARAVTPGYKITPALSLIASRIETCLKCPERHLLINMPPQEGKSSLAAVWAVIRALQLNPNRRIILATYAQSLAEDHSRAIRALIMQHGTDVLDNLTGLPVPDRLGLKLSPSARKVTSWKVEGGNGGFTAVGVGGSITGRSADLFIIDDPFKNMMEADSAAHRAKIHDWFSNVVLTRLSPEASIILIQTRWHPEDLAGKVLAGEAELDRQYRTWHHVNIPAISEVGITDSLNREPGIPMESARDGVTVDGEVVKRNFPKTRRDVGERTWYALYQGSPRNPAGGLFMRKWFEPRLEDAPPNPVAAIVGIDPADSGEGDDTGIIGGYLTSAGKVVLAEDWSGQFTPDEWAKQAVQLALTMGAREIAMEAYAAANSYRDAIRRAYRDMHRAVVEKQHGGAMLTPLEQRLLPDIPPFTIYKWRAGGKVDAVGRSALLRQALETKHCQTVEFNMSVFEEQACDWQAGQHQPDRVSAAIICHDRLAALGNGGMNITGPPTGGPRKPPPPPAWLQRKIGG
ncbi:terminase [Mycobacterium phage Phelemich]|uniref:Terminase n=2 Tax=Acadianvirus reprobate TaxID=1982903 RepID=S5YDL4_9CAUD|nr:terminase large subunit [Mycobacterium phage Phelemich]YP_008409927.1 terminase large subunit [Mycobacterium phage Reprobate]AGT12742.1 terminase [Mycobacterium phage Reprobate]AGT13920.1 terminase [Mycobacterium phage Phelemich]